MDLKLIPYTETDGIRTFTDTHIKKLFSRTVEDGLDKIVFYDGSIRTEEQFLRAMKYGDSMFFCVSVDNEIIGYTWLNRFENHTARLHFCVFQEHWGDSEELGRATLDKLMYMKDRKDRYLFDLFTGYVPAWNKRAIQFSLKCGGKTYGTIPDAIWNGETQRSEDAVFIYYTRSEQ